MNYIYEVEQFILNEIEKEKGKQLRDLIDSFTIERRRIAMFAAFHIKKDSELTEMIEKIKSTDRISELDIIIERIRKYNPISELEKKSFGEIFTPFTLINKMLDTLPVEVWSNPKLKWGDFCNGVGNFMVIIIKRLMVGLEKWEPDQDKRYKHILENMIYVAELQIKNMFFWIVSIDPRSEFKLNLYRGNSLEKEFDNHMKETWKVEKMNIIVGNPPYNAPFKDNNKQGTTGNFIWDKFVIKYLKTLNPKGYLVLVHPSGWRRPISEKSKNRNLLEIMKSKQIHYLEIHDTNDGMKTFGAGTRYDFYCLQNIPIHEKTTIKGEDGIISNINLNNWQFIPNKLFDVIEKIISTENNCDVIYNRTNYGADKNHIKPYKDQTYRYPVIHATNKKGVRYVYSSRNDIGHYGISKVIFGDSGINDVVIDINGDYAMTQHAMAIKIENLQEGEFIKKALLSDKFSKILKATSYSNFGIEWKFFTCLKKDFWKEFID